MPLERRAYDFEVRADDDSGKLVGYAAMFDSETELRDGFFEVIRPTAFNKTLADGADVRALLNHDDNFILGRTRSGTLKLSTDEKGLRVEIDPPESRSDVVEAIRRGDISQMSFGFIADKDRITRRGEDDVLRELLEVRLFDVSPVVFPAYPTTEIQARSGLNYITDEQLEELRSRLPEEETEQPVPADHCIVNASKAAHLRIRELAF